MNDFEWAVVAAFNRFFERNKIIGIAYRLKQSRYTPQVVDILVDSPEPEYYLAIECKSLDTRKTKSLYYSQHFSTRGLDNQILRAKDFLAKSGRRGFLAVELRKGTGRSKTAHIIPYEVVIKSYLAGGVSLGVDEIEKYPLIIRKDKTYEIFELI
jgi:hypothetical protein